MNHADHSFDGVDMDSEESKRLREHVPVSWQARQMVRDYAELQQMSQADVCRYCAIIDQ